MLFHLVHNHGITNALVFTKSAESTTRLVRLFEFFEKARTGPGSGLQSPAIVVAQAYSSDLGANERKTILEKFKAQEIQMYVWVRIFFNFVWILTDRRSVDWFART